VVNPYLEAQALILATAVTYISRFSEGISEKSPIRDGFSRIRNGLVEEGTLSCVRYR
jgi:hypothetical protein